MMAMMLDSVQWASIHSMLKLSSNLKKRPFTHTKNNINCFGYLFLFPEQSLQSAFKLKIFKLFHCSLTA